MWMDQVEIGIVSLSGGGSCKLEKRLEGERRSVVLASWFRSLDGSMGGGPGQREREQAGVSASGGKAAGEKKTADARD